MSLADGVGETAGAGSRNTFFRTRARARGTIDRGMHHLLYDIALCTIAAWALGVLAQLARQPVILAYLVGGFLLGPGGFGKIASQESIETISELGLIFLLFMIGLEIDLKKIASAGKSITLTAVVQILGGCILGIAAFRVLGFPLGSGKWDALYLAVAAAMSTTVVIVKVLYDKRELDTLPGRITLGVLVIQDLFAILFLAIQPSLDNLQVSVVLVSFARVGILVVTALAVSRFILPPIFKRVARLPELVLVGALAWCFLVGEFGEALHLSREMGALIAGVCLSTFPYALDVTAKVTTLRDFFVTLFFVGLGMKIPVPTGPLIGWAVAFAVFTILSRFVTTFTPLYRMGQGLRTSLLPAINLANISEFSLVILKLGLDKGHLSRPETAGIASIAFVILATLGTFAMTRSDSFVRASIPWLKRRGLTDLDDSTTQFHARGSESGHGRAARILLLGFFRTASSLLEEIARQSPELLKDVGVVDFNPQAHAGLKQRGVHVIYGDISQRDTLVHAGLESAEILVCTVPDSLLKGSTNERLVRQLRTLNAKARIIAPAEQLADVERLYRAGADFVSVPRLHEAGEIWKVLLAADKGLLGEERSRLDAQLKDRREILA